MYDSLPMLHTADAGNILQCPKLYSHTEKLGFFSHSDTNYSNLKYPIYPEIRMFQTLTICPSGGLRCQNYRNTVALRYHNKILKTLIL